MKDRIRAIMESYQLTQQQFAQKLGLGAATISSIFTGRTNPTNNHVQAIHKAFPEISTNWVLFGEGEMLVSASEISPSSSSAEGASEGVEASAELEGLGLGFSSDFETGSLFPEMASSTPLPASPSMSSGKNLSSAVLAQAALKAQLQMAQAPAPSPRKIKEIRVFFDDGTFEVFSPLNK